MKTIMTKLVEEMEKGVIPWRQPWNNGVFFPINVKSRRYYQGINVILLWTASSHRKFLSPYWGTKRTWESIGGRVKSSEAPIEIVFSYFRKYEVYNLDQVSGCEGLRKAPTQNFSPADTFLEKINPWIFDSEEQKAMYDMNTDIIWMPRKELFHSCVGYYSTLFHELTHWTAHPNRLKRPYGESDEEVYAFEELIAELGGIFLAGRLEVPNAAHEIPNHAQYLKWWVNIIKKDNNALVRASRKAQDAIKYLFSLAKGPVPCRAS